MDEVALAATIGGTVLGLAGLGATAWSTRADREQTRELATKGQAHERDLAHRARMFERRSEAYVSAAQDLRVVLTFMNSAPPVAVIPPPAPGEALRLDPIERTRIWASVRVCGSEAVNSVARRWVDASNGFLAELDRQARVGELTRLRNEARAAADELDQAMRADLDQP
jgi:hypothetical protein